MDILISVLYIISMIGCIAGFLFIKKTEQKLNVVAEIVISVICFMSYEAVVALIYSNLQIKIDLLTLSVGNIFLCLILLYFIIVKKKRQKLYIDCTDIIIHLVIVVSVIALSIHIFNGYTIGYNSGDPASHFIFAMRIVRTGEISAMHFSPLINAIAISICRPFLEWSEYYKGLILGDTVVFSLLFLLLYIMISQSMKSVKRKIFALVICFFCMFGYPLSSYIVGGYIWLTAGMLFFCFSIYCLNIHLLGIYDVKYTKMLIIVSLSVLSWTYLLFALFALLVEYLTISIIAIAKEKRSVLKLLLHNSLIFIIPGIIFLLTFIKYWNGSDNIRDLIASLIHYETTNEIVRQPAEALGMAAEAMMSNGYGYSRLYSDFLIFIPIIIGLITYCIIRRRINFSITITCIFIAGVIFSFFLCKGGYLSGYYYYKLYFVLWILCWICIKEAYLLFCDNSIAVISYAFSFLFLFITSTFQVEQRVYDQVSIINHAEGNVPELFLYTKNFKTLKNNYTSWWISQEKLQLFTYAINCLGGANNSEMLFDYQSVDDFLTMRWYMGFSGSGRSSYAMLSAEEAVNEIVESGTKYIIVLNTNGYYDNNIAIFGAYSIEYKNEAGVILRISEER